MKAILCLLFSICLLGASAQQDARKHYAKNDFEKALAAYDRADRQSLTTTDLVNYATAAYFQGQFQKCADITVLGLAREPGNAAFHRLAFFSHDELKDYAEALRHADSLFSHTDTLKLQYFDYANYGRLLIRQATALTDSLASMSMLQKADSVCTVLENRFDQSIEYATYMRARIATLMDSDQRKALAKPFYERLADIILHKTANGATDRERLKESYQYLMTYHFNVSNDISQALEYARQLLAIDPDDAAARQLVGP